MEREDDTRSRGFGFVEFDTLDEATAAIEGLNETKLGHRNIMVQHAGKPASGKPPQRRGGGRGGGRGFGGRGGGFNNRGSRGGFGDRGKFKVLLFQPCLVLYSWRSFKLTLSLVKCPSV